jgi:hypothetical protein
MTSVADRIRNVTGQRYAQLATRAQELIAQVARRSFLWGHGVGDRAGEVGGRFDAERHA